MDKAMAAALVLAALIVAFTFRTELVPLTGAYFIKQNRITGAAVLCQAKKGELWCTSKTRGDDIE